MAKRVVQVELSPAQELALLDRYGRKCSPEGAVKRAIAEILKQQEEDVPIFVSTAEHKARVEEENEAKRLREEAAKPPPEVMAIVERFLAGEKFVDLEGREVSNLCPGAVDCPDPFIAQFGGDNSEWYPVALSELRPASAQQSLVTASEVVGADPAVHPDTANEGIEASDAGN